MIAETLVAKIYRLYLDEPPQLPTQVHGEDLLHDDNLRTLLEMLAVRKSSPTMIVTASLFAKYYAYLILSGPLYMMSHEHQPLDLSIRNTRLLANDDYGLHLYVDKGSSSLPRDEQWKATMIHSIYHQNLAPLFGALNRLTGINPSILWGHASFATHWCYDLWLEATADEVMEHSLLSDLHLITQEVPMISTTKVIPHPLFSKKDFRLRKDCCLSHCLPNGNYCTTCPTINEQERYDRLTEYYAKKV